MGKDMTYWLFIGMFQGIVNITRVYRKEEQAAEAFKECLGFDWNKVNSSVEVAAKLDCSDFSGSQISELLIEP